MSQDLPAPYLVGIDAGGTKTHFRAADTRGTAVRDVVKPAGNWTALDPLEKARALVDGLASLSTEPPAALGVGAHGCDSDDECAQLETALHGLLPGTPVKVVNDAFLLPTAAGGKHAAGLVIGTGSIAVARTADGRPLYAGGWGWLFGDPASAWGTVREAVAELAAAHDRGDEIGRDPLLSTLLSASKTGTLREVVATMQNTPAPRWAEWSAPVFAAAGRGSPTARAAIERGARSIAHLVGALIERGAVVSEVVAGGSVIANEPLLGTLLDGVLRGSYDIPLRVFRGQAVAGAVALSLTLFTHTAAE